MLWFCGIWIKKAWTLSADSPSTQCFGHYTCNKAAGTAILQLSLNVELSIFEGSSTNA